MKPEHLKLLADKDWRLNNLYWITDKEGKPTRFRMTHKLEMLLFAACPPFLHPCCHDAKPKHLKMDHLAN